MNSSKPRKHHPNHFEGTTFNLEFYTSCQSSMRLEERQGVKKVYSVSTFCGSYWKTCSYNKKRKKKEEDMGFPKQGTLYGLPAKLECNQ